MDRKALLRAYKETPPPAGVFAVKNAAERRTLLGSSVNLPGMLNRQRFQLENGAHPNRELQADWDRLGPDAFAIEILDTLEPEDAPGYDPADDLAELLDMWFERMSEAGDTFYGKRPKR